jgi:hypothetical protein
MEVDRLDQEIAMKKALKSILTERQLERWELMENKKSLKIREKKKKKKKRLRK